MASDEHAGAAGEPTGPSPTPGADQANGKGAYIFEPQTKFNPATGKMEPVMVTRADGTQVQQGAMYEVDDQGRTIRAEMNDVSFVPKDLRERERAAQDGLPGKLAADHAGHFIASMFGGSPNEYNMAPMQGNEVNLSNYKRLENEIKDAAKSGKSVDFAVQAVYQGDSERPSHFNTIFTIDGQTHAVTFVNQKDQPHLYDRNAPATEW